MKKGAPRPAAGELLSSLFTLNFFANKAMTCRLVRDAPPSSSSPCGEEEERRARWRRRRGLGCKRSQYRAPISALLRGGNCSAVWYKLDLLQRLRPLARWLGACSGLLSSRHGSARKARCTLHVYKHQGSGSGKRKKGHSGLHQTYAMLATLHKAILLEHGSIFVCTPAPLFPLHRARRVSFSPAGRKRNGGRKLDKVPNLRPGCE